MKVITDVVQGSAEWHALRRGKITGTKLADVMGSPLERVQLVAELIAQEATEQSKMMRSTPEMERGSAEEPFAVRTYEDRSGNKVDKVAFCVSDEFEWLGYSPDGLVKDGDKFVGGIEIKSPDSHTAVFYRLTNMIGMEVLGLGTWLKPTKERPGAVFKPSSKEPFLGIPADYKWQVVQSFLVNQDQQWLDFLVYDARFIDAEQKLYVVRVERDNPEMQAALIAARAELIKFRVEWVQFREIIMPSNF